MGGYRIQFFLGFLYIFFIFTGLLAVIAGNFILSRKQCMTSVLLCTYNIILLFSEITNNVRPNCKMELSTNVFSFNVTFQIHR